MLFFAVGLYYSRPVYQWMPLFALKLDYSYCWHKIWFLSGYFSHICLFSLKYLPCFDTFSWEMYLFWLYFVIIIPPLGKLQMTNFRIDYCNWRSYLGHAFQLFVNLICCKRVSCNVWMRACPYQHLNGEDFKKKQQQQQQQHNIKIVQMIELAFFPAISNDIKLVCLQKHPF